MSMELMDEHEQGERVRAWLRDNGASIISGVAIGVAAIVGWQWWGRAQLEQRVDAAAQYAALTDAAKRNDRDGASAILSSLNNEFKDSSYNTLGGFVLADLQVKSGETQAAADTLRAAMAATTDPALQQVARNRLARVLLAAGNAQGALDTLGSASTGAIAEELRGDALQALGRTDEAIASYQKAYATYEEMLPSRRLVELKLINLGAKVEANAEA